MAELLGLLAIGAVIIIGMRLLGTGVAVAGSRSYGARVRARGARGARRVLLIAAAVLLVAGLVEAYVLPGLFNAAAAVGDATVGGAHAVSDATVSVGPWVAYLAAVAVVGGAALWWAERAGTRYGMYARTAAVIGVAAGAAWAVSTIIQ